MNTFKTGCITTDELDASYVYFPITCLTLVLCFLSGVGKYVKDRHLFLANFIVMESLLEHLSIVAQVILGFYYGGVVLGLLCLIIWVLYVGLQVLYAKSFKKDIILFDR